MANLFGTQDYYPVVNTYTGECKWLPLEEALELESSDNYWEIDHSRSPIHERPV